MSRVEIIEARRTFGTTPVLRGLSLAVEAGEFMVLLGPSGCGKSTLLHAIAGLDDLDDGRVLIGGRDVTALEPSERGIAMVFQSYALYPTMTVRENLAFGLRMGRVAAAEITRRVAQAAELLQIGALLDRRPTQLSGGQRQRVAIGRAIVRKVSVYLFDEPLSNLDTSLRAEMRVELRRLHTELGATMIYVTHDQTEAMTMATRIAVLKDGAVAQCDVPQALYDRPATLFVAGFLGSPRINVLPGALVGYGDVMFAIRPDDLHVLPPDADSGLRVQLLLREPLGAETLVWCTTGPAPDAPRLCLSLPPERARQLPDVFRVQPDHTRASLFDPASGTRLPDPLHLSDSQDAP